jgi:hypothetical protein
VDGGRPHRTCLKCRNSIEVDQDGRVVAHDRPVSRFSCLASGQLAALVSVEWGPGPRHSRQIVGGGKGRGRERQKKTDYLKPPEWLPNYQGEYLPAIGLPANGWLSVWFPAHTMWEKARRWCLATRVEDPRRVPRSARGAAVVLDGRRRCWLIALAPARGVSAQGSAPRPSFRRDRSLLARPSGRSGVQLGHPTATVCTSVGARTAKWV